jgi:hypothetical protein
VWRCAQNVPSLSRRGDLAKSACQVRARRQWVGRRGDGLDPCVRAAPWGHCLPCRRVGRRRVRGGGLGAERRQWPPGPRRGALTALREAGVAGRRSWVSGAAAGTQRGWGRREGVREGGGQG